MKAKKLLLLTFDYEPFLGQKSGTVKNCLLRPTEALETILNRHKAKGVFFVDTLYLMKLKEQPESKQQLTQIMEQLNHLFRSGHFIFPHIHPHWLDSSYVGNSEFDLSNLDRYSLAKFESKAIDELFTSSIKLLMDAGISYPEWGYRAGGWCIQPFSNFKEVFKKYHIRYEFSVLPGYQNNSSTQFFDYSMVEKQTPYFFSNQVETEVVNGEYIEFPISTIEIPKNAMVLDKVIRKYLWKTGDKGFGDGLSAKTAALKTNLNDKEMISVELLSYAKLKQYKKFIKNNEYMHWISHPKMFSRHNLKMLDRFLEFVNLNYDVVYDFKQMY